MKRRRFRKSTVILLGFTLYSVAVYAYFIPRTDMSSRHIWATMALNAVILVALWYLYRRREKLADKRGQDVRKLMLSLLLMMAAIGAKAQFEKGTTYVAASTTSLGLSYSSSEKLNFGLDFTGGYFVQSAWMLYGKLGYDHTRYTDHFQMGVGGRYYFTQNGIYMGLGLQYEHATKSVNNLQLCPEVGYAFFVNRFITIEPAVYYHMSLNDFSDGSKVGLKLGLGFYF